MDAILSSLFAVFVFSSSLPCGLWTFLRPGKSPFRGFLIVLPQHVRLFHFTPVRSCAWLRQRENLPNRHVGRGPDDVLSPLGHEPAAADTQGEDEVSPNLGRYRRGVYRVLDTVLHHDADIHVP